MKTCLTCRETKDERSFYRNRHLKDGYNQYCKSCWKLYTNNRRSRPEVRAKVRAQGREYNNRPEIRARLDAWCRDNWASRIVHKAESHASQRTRKQKSGITCTITREFIIELWEKQEGRCYYSGLPLVREMYKPDSVSLDRIDTKRGYEPDNVALTCNAMNRAKNAHSEQEFRDFLRRLADALNSHSEAAE